MITHIKIKAPFDSNSSQCFFVSPALKEKIFAIGAVLVLDHNHYSMITPDGDIKKATWTVVEVMSDRPTTYTERRKVYEMVRELISVSSVGRPSWGTITFKFLQGLVFTSEKDLN